jgi:hypothetical protein
VFCQRAEKFREVLDCGSPLPLLHANPAGEKAAGGCRSPRRWRASDQATTRKWKNIHSQQGLCTSQTGHLFYPQMTRITRIKIKKICVHL